MCASLLSSQTAAFCQDQMQTVTVNLTDGRQFHGQIDPQSTRERLVLRSASGPVTIWRPLPWAQLARVESGGQPLDLSELRAQAAASSPAPNPLTKTIRLRTLGTPAPPKPPKPDTAPPIQVPRVTNVAIDAALANWDADVEADGLLVDLSPLGADGALAAVAGTVEVELYVPERRTFDLAPLSGGDTLELLERWTRAIEPGDFGPSGARLKLPFGAIHPELRPDWVASHYGLVHLRFSAPGHGVFEASRDGVRIQTWAPNRDRLELQTGSRFLPTETLGRQP